MTITNKHAYRNALARYFKALDNAIGSVNQPTQSESTVTQNGTVFLKNRNGLLAVVNNTGMVFDRIGGARLDEVTA